MLSNEELVKLVTDIMNAEGTEEEIDSMLDLLCKSVPHPSVSDLIFWNDEDLSPEEIVDIALTHQSIVLPEPEEDLQKIMVKPQFCRH
ncbi:bacteriocin immunity protein [Paenibacillus thiaminolyticus]|uniref:bacteriocin immunity protein n=1 Tax=Paenibacillus thiaminolyticus TaxID=49283 RepID=UPI0030B9236F